MMFTDEMKRITAGWDGFQSMVGVATAHYTVHGHSHACVHCCGQHGVDQPLLPGTALAASAEEV